MTIDQELSNTEADTSNEEATVATVNSFSAIISSHSQQAVNDDQDSEAFGPPSPWVRVPIAELFDFRSAYWESLYTRFAGLSFEDELALYDLADLDAEGERDDETEVVDDSTEFILTS